MISSLNSCSLMLPIQLLMTPYKYKGLSQSNRPWPLQYLFHYFGPFFHHGQVFFFFIVDYSQDISKYLSAVFILSLVLSIAITSPYQGVICLQAQAPSETDVLTPSCFDCNNLIETVSFLRCQHKLDSHQDLSK